MSLSISLSLAFGTLSSETTVSYLGSIRIYNSRIRASELASSGPKPSLPETVDNCIVRTNDFGSVLSHVISSFGSILEETFDIDTIYVQNPPKRARASIEAFHDPSQIEVINYPYPALSKETLSSIFENVEEQVFGQEKCKKSVLSALYRLSVLKGGRPGVILMYGPSGIGKTELSKSISQSLGGNLTRIQFSMMQTNEAYEYLYGAEHSKASFSRDLLSRESNVVLIDEFDKVTPRLYNMFYQVFDEGRYVDTNYEVDMSDGLFLLTSNFSSEREIQRVLGPAMFSRIDECVQFEEIPDELKQEIATNHYISIVEQLDDEDRSAIEQSDIQEWFQCNISRYSNMRTMKIKIEKAIFEHLSKRIIDASSATSDSGL